MKLNITIVSNSLIPAIFEKIIPFLELGQKHFENRYNIEDFFELLYRGEMQLWVAVEEDEIKMIMLTQISVYPRSKWIRIWYIAGKRFKDVEWYLDNIEAWGQAYGAVGFEVIGRIGWKRRLKALGFREWNMILIKDFSARSVN